MGRHLSEIHFVVVIYVKCLILCLIPFLHDILLRVLLWSPLCFTVLVVFRNIISANFYQNYLATSIQFTHNLSLQSNLFLLQLSSSTTYAHLLLGHLLHTLLTAFLFSCRTPLTMPLFNNPCPISDYWNCPQVERYYLSPNELGSEFIPFTHSFLDSSLYHISMSLHNDIICQFLWKTRLSSFCVFVFSLCSILWIKCHLKILFWWFCHLIQVSFVSSHFIKAICWSKRNSTIIYISPERFWVS